MLGHFQKRLPVAKKQEKKLDVESPWIAVIVVPVLIVLFLFFVKANPKTPMHHKQGRTVKIS